MSAGVEWTELTLRCSCSAPNVSCTITTLEDGPAIMFRCDHCNARYLRACPTASEDEEFLARGIEPLVNERGQ